MPGRPGALSKHPSATQCTKGPFVRAYRLLRRGLALDVHPARTRSAPFRLGFVRYGKCRARPRDMRQADATRAQCHAVSMLHARVSTLATGGRGRADRRRTSFSSSVSGRGLARSSFRSATNPCQPDRHEDALTRAHTHTRQARIHSGARDASFCRDGHSADRSQL